MGLLRRFLTARALNTKVHKAINETIEATNDTKVLISALTDELKAAEEEIRRSEKKYREMYELMKSVIDAVPGAVWGKDVKGRFILTNKPLRDLLANGRDIDDVLGKTTQELADMAGREDTIYYDAERNDRAILETERVGSFIETGYINGVKRVFKVNKAPLYDRFGTLIGTVGFGRDITDVCRAAFTVLSNVQEATNTCPRECVYSTEINDMLASTIDILKDVISVTCDIKKKDKSDGRE